MDRLKSDGRVPETVSYQINKLDEELNLHSAVPVGVGSEKARQWNTTIYWAGDKDSYVNTLISCPNGLFRYSNIVGKCQHEFIYTELNAKVSIRYTKNWLYKWKDIQTKVEKLLSSFIGNLK